MLSFHLLRQHTSGNELILGDTNAFQNRRFALSEGQLPEGTNLSLDQQALLVSTILLLYLKYDLTTVSIAANEKFKEPTIIAKNLLEIDLKQ